MPRVNFHPSHQVFRNGLAYVANVNAYKSSKNACLRTFSVSDLKSQTRTQSLDVDTIFASVRIEIHLIGY